MTTGVSFCMDLLGLGSRRPWMIAGADETKLGTPNVDGPLGVGVNAATARGTQSKTREDVDVGWGGCASSRVVDAG